MSNDTRRKVGSIRQRGDRWQARVTVGIKADGSRREDVKTFATEREAEIWCHVRAHEMGASMTDGMGLTLKRLWELYQTAKDENLAPTTMNVYAYHMNYKVLPVLGERDVSEIRHGDIQTMLSGMSHGTAQKARTVLSSVLTYGVRVGLLDENVMRKADFEIPSDDRSADDEAWDDDPFALIEEDRKVWDAETIAKCYELIQGLPLEPVWLACVGAGLRVEEALALRPVDVRRVKVMETEVTQLAIHHATAKIGDRKGTKTRGSVRVVTMLEPFGERYWELAQAVKDKKDTICKVSASRQNKAWRNYFDEPTTAKHAKKKGNWRGALRELPYLPLTRMRNTHATLMQEAGVLDSVNAAMHGHSQRVSYAHYQRADTTEATVKASAHLKLVV